MTRSEDPSHEDASRQGPHPGPTLAQPGSRHRPPASLRLSDAERNSVTEALSRHYTDGRLDGSELRDRLERAMRARTRADLGDLLDDLPEAPTFAFEPPPPQPLVHDPSGLPPAGVRPRPATPLYVWLYPVEAAFFVIVWLLTSPGGYFWPAWPIVIWGLVVGVLFAKRRLAATRQQRRWPVGPAGPSSEAVEVLGEDPDRR
ncbi:MAG: DUF1707 domain-containing protein [Acidimicrobiales bacterium]